MTALPVIFGAYRHLLGLLLFKPTRGGYNLGMDTDQDRYGEGKRVRLRHLVTVYNAHWHHLNEAGRVLVADFIRTTLGDCADGCRSRKDVFEIKRIMSGLPFDWAEQVGSFSGRKRKR